MIPSADPSTGILALPFYYLPLLLGGGFLLWLLTALASRKNKPIQNGETNSDEPDWTIPSVDAGSEGNSLFHRWDPRIKICALVGFMFLVSSLQQITWVLPATAVSMASVAIARIPWRNVLRRITAMGAFLGMFLVVMPLTAADRPDDLRIVFDGIPWMEFNLRGLHLAALICLKAVSIAILAEPLLTTAPFSVTIQALVHLKVPSVLCQMLLLSHRYIFVFQDEAARMMRGMRARGFRRQSDVETLRTIGNFLGMLLVRSFERTQRVFDAMVSRGYSGAWPIDMAFTARTPDWIHGICWISGGLFLVIGDRWLWYA